MDSEIKKIYETVGSRIVIARKKRGMSQEKLATESGLDRSHLGFIEQGRRKPTLRTLYKISKALDLSFESLFKDI